MEKNFLRNKLISLAVKYCGDAKKIREAWNRGEGDPNYVYLGNAITSVDDEFPDELDKLTHLDDCPLVLFYKGNLDLLKQKKISVVGSRTPLEYSKDATKRFVLAQNAKVIVSGLEVGIDTIAHKYADKTIAVLGSGIDYAYLYKNLDLYNRIASEGLIISEYPLDTKPKPEYFKTRRRIIAALSEELVVMEAKKASGTLSTVHYAKCYGTKVRVLPQSSLNNYSVNNELIKNGAEILCSEDFDTEAR